MGSPRMASGGRAAKLATRMGKPLLMVPVQWMTVRKDPSFYYILPFWLMRLILSSHNFSFSEVPRIFNKPSI